MKIRRKLQISLLIVIIALSFSSCLKDDDSYSLNNYWVGFGMIETASNAEDFIIKLDDGEVLVPISFNSFWQQNNIKDSNRVIVNFTKLGDVKSEDATKKGYYVRINAIDKILLKNIHPYSEATADSIGNDPIVVEKAWIAQDLVNLKLKYWSSSKMHLINLVDSMNNNSDVITLKVKHNAHEDNKDFPSTAFVSFYIKNLQKEGQDSVQIKLINKDYEGTIQEKLVTYRY